MYNGGVRTPNSIAVPYTIAALMSLGGAYMAWGGSDNDVSPVVTGTVFVNAWNSQLVGGHSLAFPNTIPLLIAVVLAFWAWAEAPKSKLVMPAIVYCFGHLLFAANAFYGHGGGMVGAGLLITFVAYVVMASATATYIRAQRQGAVDQSPG